jgi:hypothetical protein
MAAAMVLGWAAVSVVASVVVAGSATAVAEAGSA